MFKINDFQTRLENNAFLKSLIILVSVSLLITIILAFKYYSSQKFYENGISKRNVIAKFDFDVTDTRKTEFQRRERANKVRPIITPIDEAFVKSSLGNFEHEIKNIKELDISSDEKYAKILQMLEINNPDKERAVTRFLLGASVNQIEDMFTNSNYVLAHVLRDGITDVEFPELKVENIAKKTLGANSKKQDIQIISGILEHVITPNLIEDEYATEIARRNARNLVRPHIVKFKKGDYILREGEPVTELKKAAIEKSGYNVLELDKWGIVGMFMLSLITVLAAMLYIKRYEPKFYKSNYIAILSVTSIILTAICVLMLNTGATWGYLMPIPAFVIILSVFTSPNIAFLFSILFLVLFSMTLQFDMQLITIFLFGSIMGVFASSKINYSKRFDIIKCGFEVGVVMFLATCLIALFKGQLFTFSKLDTIIHASLCLLNGVISGIIALGIIPLIEDIFKVFTPYSLIELTDHKQDLLRNLEHKAPGTYHHSMTVANLCEAAAEAIGADPILARVGAIYHDIGKLRRPQFFIENQSYFDIENPHVKLKLNPRLSKMVITSHTREGAEMAQEHHLPQAIIDFIQQHHGDSLAGHFYNKAVSEEGIDAVDMEQFRYPGPKPSTKEIAILMIADAVESAVRSMKGATQEEVEEMINKIITERLNDGQLSDSPLTLKDIKTIAITFNRIMKGMMHDRVKYEKPDLSDLDETKIRLLLSKEEALEKKIAKKVEENKEKQNEDKNNN